MAAKFYGTCQICGNRHKVVGGNQIATHGYTLDFGCFIGACYGSKEQPWELSSDAIQKTIDSIDKIISQLQVKINGLTKPSDLQDENGYFTIRVRVPTRTDYKLEVRKVKLEEVTRYGKANVIAVCQGKQPSYVGRVESIKEAELYLLKDELDQLRKQVWNASKMREQLQAKISTWELKALTPI